MKLVYEFPQQGVKIFRDGRDVVVEVAGKPLRFSTLRQGHDARSPADQLRRAIQLHETDIFYDPEGKRPEMVGAGSVP